MESAELIAILREVKDRVRAHNPQTSAGGIDVPLPDLMPLVHARDAALGKVAAIGTVNPRSGGVINAAVQVWKRLIARVLDWHVRDQVEFNRRVIACLDAAIEALNDNNRAMTELAARFAELSASHSGEINALKETVSGEVQDLKDIRLNWTEWRAGWEQKLATNEIQFLRSVADLQGAFQHRATLMDANYRDALRAMHTDFHGALDRYGVDIQRRIWADLEKIRLEYEHLIYTELRTVRQRAEVRAALPKDGDSPASNGQAAAERALLFDYGKFAEKFRGPEEYVKKGQQIYLPHFAGRSNVLDIGCGRGEFLELMRDNGVGARGIDLSDESIATCQSKGLQAEKADLFAYLAGLPEASLDGVFCSQVVEHLPPERLPEMIRLCSTRLTRGAPIAIETPNPECLAIFSTHFFLDPTHTRPIPPALLGFYLEEFGIGRLELKRLSPAADSIPSVQSLPGDFREAFFGYLDYALLGKKL